MHMTWLEPTYGFTILGYGFYGIVLLALLPEVSIFCQGTDASLKVSSDANLFKRLILEVGFASVIGITSKYDFIKFV